MIKKLKPLLFPSTIRRELATALKHRVYAYLEINGHQTRDLLTGTPGVIKVRVWEVSRKHARISEAGSSQVRTISLSQVTSARVDPQEIKRTLAFRAQQQKVA